MLKELHIYSFQKEVKELNNIQCMFKCLSYNSVIVSSYQANAHHSRIQYIEKNAYIRIFSKRSKNSQTTFNACLSVLVTIV